MPKVNADILTWTREEAGLSIVDAAQKLRIVEAYGKSPEERLVELESGTKIPSRTMLKNMSKLYRRPLLTFYLSDPPEKSSKGHDFRTLPDAIDPRDDLLVNTLVRDVMARQDLLRAALEEEDEAVTLPYVGSAKVENGVAKVADNIRRILDFHLTDFRNQTSAKEAFAFLRRLVESAGVFVLLIGDLGSWHTEIDSTIFRGFALADPVTPFIIINTNDSYAAWSFTLIHELTHIWLGQTGISDKRAGNPIEKFCNDVASHLLLPVEELLQINIDKRTEVNEAARKIEKFSEPRNVSRAMVAYKLFRLDRIESKTWRSLSIRYSREWADNRTRIREQRRLERENQTDSDGPNYHIVRKYRLGDRLLTLVNRMMITGTLSTAKAAKVLGVKPISVYKLTSLADMSLGF